MNANVLFVRLRRTTLYFAFALTCMNALILRAHGCAEAIIGVHLRCSRFLLFFNPA